MNYQSGMISFSGSYTGIQTTYGSLGSVLSEVVTKNINPIIIVFFMFLGLVIFLRILSLRSK